MTSIILSGSSRSGKTTLARRLQKELGYSLISGDALICTFEAIYPQLGITHDGDHDTICRTWENFIVVYINHLTQYEDIPFILDTFHLMPEQVARLKLHEKYIVRFLGYPDLTAQEKLDAIRTYKTDHYDWTDERSDPNLLQDVTTFVRRSKDIMTQCALLGLPFINTSQDFENRIDSAFSDILQTAGRPK